MRRALLLFVGVLLLAGTNQAQTGTDPNEPDTLIIDSAVAYITGSGAVPFYITNDETLSALEITVLHDGTGGVVIDSFSFDGGRLDIDGASNGFSVTDDSSAVVIFSFLNSTLLQAGTGEIGKLHFSYPQSAGTQLVTIDTTTIVEGFIEYQTTFKIDDILADPFIPQFIEGYMDIQETPESFDSIWVDTLEAEATHQVAIDVHQYNERDLAEIQLVLSYESGLLVYDSVTFTGTRGAAAASKTVQHQLSSSKLFIVTDFGDASPLAPGTGTIATLHFTVDESTPDTTFYIDTTTIGVSNVTQETLTAADGGGTFQPFFTEGWVEVVTATDADDQDNGESLPNSYALAQNYPNPFNPATQIGFSLPEATHVRLEVFNILGRSVGVLMDKDMTAGNHFVTFDAEHTSGGQLATGVYFYRITTDGFTQTRKMLLMK